MERTAVDGAIDADIDKRLRATFEKFGCVATGGSFREYEASKGKGKR